MTNAEQLWEICCEEAEKVGMSAADLERLIVLPLKRGGAGWPFWRIEKTTEALAQWLRKRIEERRTK